jgi:hypothetical protein
VQTAKHEKPLFVRGHGAFVDCGLEELVVGDVQKVFVFWSGNWVMSLGQTETDTLIDEN